ncbi:MULTISPECIES: acyltransferase [Kordiimonas]|jgi:UDP-3-O-[3-hydroxymyristoyl] glucosamine N-acyltransferase|uniref:acyltransferase n=1 Tax=Kordiimonas TaxID=288021 RepID=UPI00257D757E|nr:DapH/DapD/GlmU-related protein [Kordiimonas sp. UBA4487]
MLILNEPVYTSQPRIWHEHDIQVGAFCVIEASPDHPVCIGAGTKFGHCVIVSSGVTLAENVRLDSQSFVGANTSIGAGSEIHGVKVFRDVHIGQNSFIGGEVSNWTVIGNEVTFMGRIVHTYRKPGNSDDWRHSSPQPSPQIGDQSVIGENALLIGGIKIGARAYVAAGEILKSHVPDDHIAIKQQILPLSAFRGFITSRVE